VANKAWTPGRARIRRTPPRGECRDVPAALLLLACAKCTYLCTQGSRVRPAPGIPRALLFSGAPCRCITRAICAAGMRTRASICSLTFELDFCAGAACGGIAMLFAVASTNSVSSPRRRGPITTRSSCCAKLGLPACQTTSACGYGSRIGARYRSLVRDDGVLLFRHMGRGDRHCGRTALQPNCRDVGL